MENTDFVGVNNDKTASNGSSFGNDVPARTWSYQFFPRHSLAYFFFCSSVRSMFHGVPVFNEILFAEYQGN